jgi:hypothetical protein
MFNANELKQNLGASALVEQATHEWLIHNLPSNRNAQWEEHKHKVIFDAHTLDDGIDAEVIFLGGGNAAIMFSSGDQARDFAKKYTDQLLERAPGLEAAVAHVDNIDLSQKDALQNAWTRMLRMEMPRQKEGRMVSQPVLGLAVTAECSYTGLPAVAENSDGRLLSAQAYAKQS